MTGAMGWAVTAASRAGGGAAGTEGLAATESGQPVYVFKWCVV